MSNDNLYRGLIERYAARLPIAADARIISLSEGDTPLIRLRNIESMLSNKVQLVRQV